MLPLQNGEYDIPTPKRVSLGLALDIRPPTQALNLLSGSRSVENNADNSRLLLPNTPENTTLYEQVSAVLADKGVALAKSDGTKQIVTDWITWTRADENVPSKVAII